MDILILGLTVLAGCLMPVQPALNAVTAQLTGSPYIAAMFSFLTGGACLTALCLIVGVPWQGVRLLGHLPWWLWTAGPMGAFFVTITMLAIPRLGAMTAMAVLITAQMASSLCIDHFGWFSLPQHPISPLRVLGGVLLLVGVFLIRKF